MDKKTTQYLKNYFSHNGIVLACELLIVLLLSRNILLLNDYIFSFCCIIHNSFLLFF